MSLGRNDFCPCGSGKKYKRCCLGTGKYSDAGQASDITSHLERAESAFSLGDITRARQFLEPFLARPRVPLAVLVLASRIEMTDKNFEKAAAHMEMALKHEPKNPLYLYNYGTSLALTGDQNRAVQYFRRALELKPDFQVVYQNLANTLRDLGRSGEALEAYQKAFAYQGTTLSNKSQILLTLHLFCADEHDKQFDMHCQLGREISLANPPNLSPRREIAPREKIRLGYLSPRFSNEIVGYFFKPLFDNHDREKFELYLYCATPRTDDLTSYLSQRADRWRDVGSLSDTALCQQITTDEIDVLIDLAGHAPENRMTAIARKPAPIQITMLDYFDTTGVDAIDYFVTDHYSSPESSPQRFTEELIYLDQPRLVYEAPDYAPPVRVRSRGASGPVFGSFNRHHKIVPHVIETWAGLLNSVPGSTLILKSGQFSSSTVQQSFHAKFASHGIEISRIEFRGASPHVDMLAQYSEIDIALDTFPYNGGLTTCEALWMGTPVITLLGNSVISRQTAGMLQSVGLPEFIATDAHDFAKIGGYWAARPHELDALRLSLRDKMAASPLTNGAGYAANFENCLQQICRNYTVSLASGKEKG